MKRCAQPLALAALAALTVIGCASGRRDAAKGPFTAAAPFSKKIAGSGDAVCWSVKRAMLSQGYMLDRPTDSGVLTGTMDYQPKPKQNITIHLQTTCADNRDGTACDLSLSRVIRQTDANARGRPSADKNQQTLGNSRSLLDKVWASFKSCWKACRKAQAA